MTGNKYVAVQLSGDIVQTGFSSVDEAWNYIAENEICDTCKDDLKRGYHEGEAYRDEKGEPVIYRDEIKHPWSTMCGCEWTVMTEEDLNEYSEDGQSL